MPRLKIMIRTLFLILLFQSCLHSQDVLIMGFMESGQRMISNKITCLNDGSFIVVNNGYEEIGLRPRDGFNRLVKFNSEEGFEIERYDIESESTSSFYDSELIAIGDSLLILTGVKNNGDSTMLWLALLDSSFAIQQEYEFKVIEDDESTFVRQMLTVVKGDLLFVYGNAEIQNFDDSRRFFSLVLDISDGMNLISREAAEYVVFPGDAMFLNGQWFLYSSGMYVSDSLMLGWERNLNQGISLVAGQTSLLSVNEYVYAFSKWTGDLTFRSGGVLRKLDRDFNNVVSRVYEKLLDDDFVPGKGSLVYDSIRSSIFTCGTLGHDPFEPGYPFLRRNSMISLVRHDLDLNEIFSVNFGGDASYDVFDTELLPNGNIAICGFRYYDETDLMEGFLLVVSGEDGTVSTEHSYPVSHKPLVIYPNPAQGIVQLKIPDLLPSSANTELWVYGASGMEVLRLSSWNTTDGVDVSSLPSGHYTIIVATEEQRYVGKLVKQ